MADLTVNSLSLTPQASWPVDPSAGIVAARTNSNRIQVVAQGEALPTSSTSDTWSGTPSVQTDFSP